MAEWTRMPPGLRFTTPLLIAVGAGIVAVGATIPSIGPVVRAIGLSGADDESADPLDKHLKEYDSLTLTSVARFEGRTPFFPPPAPKPPPPPKPKPKPPEPPAPPPPPKPAPAEYDGPQPTGLFGDIVFFDANKVKVGQKFQTVEVLEATGPWNIKLKYTKAGHEPGEYVVSTWKGTGGFDLGAPNPFPETSLFKESTSGEDDAKSAAAPDKPSGEHAAHAPALGGAKGPVPKGAAAKKAGEGSDGSRGGARPGGVTPPAQDAPSPTIPAARSQEQIDELNAQDAAQALVEVRTALELSNLDNDTKARLEAEAKLLTARLESLSGGTK